MDTIQTFVTLWVPYFCLFSPPAGVGHVFACAYVLRRFEGVYSVVQASVVGERLHTASSCWRFEVGCGLPGTDLAKVVGVVLCGVWVV